MKIALHHTRFGTTGGSEGYLAVLVRRLLEKGHQVHVFTPRVVGDRIPPGLHVHLLKTARFPHWRKVLSFARAQARAARDPSFDLVVGFGRTLEQDLYRDGSGPQADYLAWRASMKPPWSRPFLFLDPTQRITLALERARFSHPGLVRIQAVSGLVRDALARRYPHLADRIRVVHNGVDTRRFSPKRREALRREALAALDLREGPTTFLFLGNDYLRKGLDLLLAGLAGLGGDWRLLVAGRERRLGFYQSLAARMGLKERVRWLGPRQNVDHLYAASEALLFPTRFDTFPNVPLEAMASGLPAAVSAAAGTAEVLKGEAKILRVENPGDPSSWNRAARALLEPSFREKAARAGLDLALREFTWEKHLEKLLPLYEEAARLKKRP